MPKERNFKDLLWAALVQEKLVKHQDGNVVVNTAKLLEVAARVHEQVERGKVS